ncbi:MAG TPA: undecaprenyl-diphosphate phosphatase [Balneolaceae bacterium]
MELIDSFLLGLLQGITEFLPISSSGHLVLGEAFLGGEVDKNITFEVVVHFGTLCSIVVYYHEKLRDILSSIWSLLRNPGEFSNKAASDSNIKLAGFILLSLIPAVIVGLTMREAIKDIFLNPFMVSIMLLITGVILFATRFRDFFTKHLSAKSAFIIGLAQAVAIIPGISRSGSTISMGLYLGVKREEIANFSFLMVIPVYIGAMLLKVIDMIALGIPPAALLNLFIGFVASFISGYFALKYLIIFLQSKGIDPFAWYCWAVGIAGLIYFW